MGVKGLWKILEPVARPISSPESLAGQKVAIDASIWLYQFMRVIPPTTSDHSILILSGLFNRLCKLLYFNIRPVLVFDGVAPMLKQKTIKERTKRRVQAEERYRRIARRIIATQLHLNMLKGVSRKAEDTFEGLGNDPTIEEPSQHREPDDEPTDGEIDEEYVLEIDVDSPEFSGLPIDTQQEILLAKKEQLLKQRLEVVRDDEKEINALDFSNMQVDALVKRRKIATQLERANEGSMIDYEKDYATKDPAFAKRIASDASRSYVLMKNRSGGWTIDGSIEKPHRLDRPKNEITMNLATDVISETDDLFGNKETTDDQLEKDVIIGTISRRTQTKDMREYKELSFNPLVYLSTKETAHLLTEIPEESSLRVEQINDIKSDKSPDAGKITEPKSPMFDDPLTLTTMHSFGKYKGASSSSESNDKTDDEQGREEEEEEVENIGLYKELFVPNNQFNSPNDVSELIEKLQAEVELLRNESNPANITTIDNGLLDDFRVLLTMMGIPWLVAPSEAEAQCAWLQKESLVDAVISDDNDTLLFGATKMYRHFFNNSKKIGMFLMRDIERELQLERDRLILLAILLGSDYNVGVRGIGPMRAMRLLKTIRTTNLLKCLDIIREGLLNGIWSTTDGENDLEAGKFLEKLSIQCGISDESLLNEEVANQYLSPIIDNAKPKFRWKFLPDLTRLNSFLQKKLKWTPEQCKKVIDPIISRQLTASKSKQTTLNKFIDQ